jgi:hypothetical protein
MAFFYYLYVIESANIFWVIEAGIFGVINLLIV